MEVVVRPLLLPTRQRGATFSYLGVFSVRELFKVSQKV
jgi:hypothetical protein